MTRIFGRAFGACALAAAFVAVVLGAPAQANVQIPGINGKIAFNSTRDFAPLLSLAQTRGGGPAQLSCARETDDPDCGIEIYSMNPDGSAQTRLTNNTSSDIEPAWLPADGATIAFSSNRAGDCNESCNYDIFSMPGGGETLGAATQLTNDDGDSIHPSYSPDGTRIAYAGVNPNVQKPSSRQVIYEAQEPWEIFTIPAGGESAGARVPLLPSDQTGSLPDGSTATDFYPAWSPDGSKVAFTRLLVKDLGPVGKIALDRVLFDYRTWVAPANGAGPATPVENYDQCETVGTFAPQVRAYTAALRDAIASGAPDAMGKALANRGLSLPSGCTWDFKPAWSPDGTKIAVTRQFRPEQAPPAADRGLPFGEDDGDIVVVDPATHADIANLSNVTEPTDCNTDNDEFCSVDEYPSWSPDGTKIAFDSDRGSDGLEPEQCFGEVGFDCFNVWTMNADGTNPVQLTASGSGDNFFPDWQRIPPPVPPAAPAAPAPAVPPKVGVAGVRRACVANAFRVRFRIATTASTVKSVVVKLDGKRIKRTAKGSFTLTINAKKLKSGRHRLTITATDSNGHVTTTRKSFSVCKAAKPRRRTAPRFTG